MNPEPDEMTPAARRLDAYLETLRTDPPRADAALVPKIVRRARWQRTIRAPLHAAGTLLGAIADGIALLIGSNQGRRP